MNLPHIKGADSMAYVRYLWQGTCVRRKYVVTAFRPTGCLSGRGEISSLSSSSAARMRRYLRACRAEYSVFITLTYPRVYPTDGIIVKRHLRRFLDRYAYIAGDGFSAFWFIEFQERGAPHFHIFGTHEIPKEHLSEMWYRIVDSGDERHLQAGTRIESMRAGRFGTVSYASKYALKQSQKAVPENFTNVGRFWGVAGLRECYAATIVFDMDCAKSTHLKRFHADLVSILERFRPLVRITRWGYGSTLISVRSEEVLPAFGALFHRYGITASAGSGISFDAPLLFTPVE